MKKEQAIFEQTLKTHNRALGRLDSLSKRYKDIPQNELNNVLMRIINSSKELCMVDAKFKCEKCGVRENLQFHHLIERRVKPFMKWEKYMRLRHYYANVVILCGDCHNEYHQFERGTDRLNIPHETIMKFKMKYGIC